jgi:hypothetical protein
MSDFVKFAEIRSGPYEMILVGSAKLIIYFNEQEKVINMNSNINCSDN